MSYIHLKNVRAVGDKLLEHSSILKNIYEEIKVIEGSLTTTSYIDEAMYLMKECEGELEEQALILRQLGSCLLEVTQIYEDTENKIADYYNLEVIENPKTEFGLCKITGLEEYEYLLTFRQEEGV